MPAKRNDTRLALIYLITKNKDNEQLIRALYFFTLGYLGEEANKKAPDGLPSDQSAQENISPSV